MGKQSKGIYLALQRRTGIGVVFFRSVLPWYVSFLRPIIASYEGLVRIDDRSILPEVFLKLMQRSMVGLYFVDGRFEEKLIAEASGKNPADDLGVKDDSGYCYYVVDADNAESSTGIVEMVSYGLEAPLELIRT